MRKKALCIFMISTILAQDSLKIILEDALFKKASIQIYCLSPFVLYYAPLSQEEIRETTRSMKHRYTALYSYSQYQRNLRIFLHQHNVSTIQTFTERRPYTSCVVDIIHQNKIIHTLSFSEEHSNNKLIERVFIDNTPYLLKGKDIGKTFKLLFCPNADEYKNNNPYKTNKQE